MSTVYMPGGKITMLPDALVDAFTLKADGIAPCVSLYCRGGACRHGDRRGRVQGRVDPDRRQPAAPRDSTRW
jgi:exoribonuclease II